MTRNRKVSCNVCYKEMRSDHLIRHMKHHSAALQSTEQICKDIVLELVDKVVDMQSAHTTTRKFEDNDSDEDLEKEMDRNNIEYKRKITLDKGLRGGLSMIVNQYAKTNNLEMKEYYDPKLKTSYIFFTDANNLYGWVMSQALPTGGKT